MVCKKYYIYLDFDGVIAHSATECINTAIGAFNRLASGQKQVHLDPLLMKKTIDLASQNRHLVLPPENFFCLIKVACEFAKKGITSPSLFEEKFNRELSAADRSVLIEFKEHFFSIREHNSSSREIGAWFVQNPATTFILNLMPKLTKSNVAVEIVSRKDESSLRLWAAESPFEFDAIHGNHALSSYENNKFQLISSLQHERGNQSALFFDDAAGEISGNDWGSIGVAPTIAGWGYNRLTDNTDIALKNVEDWLNDISD